MANDDIIFSTLHPDGRVTDVRTIQRADIFACPFTIMAVEHYRDDGSCRCDDPGHREFMIREWEYTLEDFDNIPLREVTGG